MTSYRILIPVEFPEPDVLPASLVAALTGNEVVLLGWWDPEDGHPTGTSEAEFRRTVQAHLHEEAARLLREGTDVTVDVHPGDDERSVRQRIAAVEDVDAVFVPGEMGTFGRLLIPVRDDRSADRIASFLTALDLSAVIHVTLFHVAEDDPEDARAMLSSVGDRIEDAGVPGVSIDVEVTTDRDPGFAIAKRARSYDAVLMGQTEESVVDGIFGPTYDRVSDQADVPVVVLRRD